MEVRMAEQTAEIVWILLEANDEDLGQRLGVSVRPKSFMMA